MAGSHLPRLDVNYPYEPIPKAFSSRKISTHSGELNAIAHS